MRVLTVRQPWAWAIVAGGKSVENRSQEWSYRGLVAIHAGKGMDAAALEHPGIRAAVAADPGARFAGSVAAAQPFLPAGLAAADAFGIRMYASAVLGVVNMVGAHRGDDDCCPGNVWADRAPGAVHVVLRNPIVFRAPVGPVVGRLGLWKPDDDLMTGIRDALLDTLPQGRADRIPRPPVTAERLRTAADLAYLHVRSPAARDAAAVLSSMEYPE